MPGLDGLQGRSGRQAAANLRPTTYTPAEPDHFDSSATAGAGLGSSPKRVVSEDPMNPASGGTRRGPLGGNLGSNNGTSSGRFRNGSHPGRIMLPSFNGFGQVNPLSPVQARGMPPMTPSVSRLCLLRSGAIVEPNRIGPFADAWLQLPCISCKLSL